MKGSRDGSKWGLSDWYPDIERGIQRALKCKRPWTTGWYASKKEIASACISSDGKALTVQVSVTDDFDTEGKAVRSNVPLDIDALRGAIDEAWEAAEEDRFANARYVGWSVHKRTKKGGGCIDYFIVDIDGLDHPPGDSYYHWGWQESDDEGKTPSFKIPKKTAQQLANHAMSFKTMPFRVGVWEIVPWVNASNEIPTQNGRKQ